MQRYKVLISPPIANIAMGGFVLEISHAEDQEEYLDLPEMEEQLQRYWKLASQQTEPESEEMEEQ